MGLNNSLLVFKLGPHFRQQEAQVGCRDLALLGEQCGLNFILFELNLLCPCPHIALLENKFHFLHLKAISCFLCKNTIFIFCK
jgi:hypothetical protein